MQKWEGREERDIDDMGEPIPLQRETEGHGIGE